MIILKLVFLLNELVLLLVEAYENNIAESTLSSTTTNLFRDLTDKSLCYKNITELVPVNVTSGRWVTETHFKVCWSIPPVCEYNETRYEEFTEVEIQNVTHQLVDCCPGYKLSHEDSYLKEKEWTNLEEEASYRQVMSNTITKDYVNVSDYSSYEDTPRCRPECHGKCKEYGECVEPELCLCHSGDLRSSCDQETTITLEQKPTETSFLEGNSAVLEDYVRQDRDTTENVKPNTQTESLTGDWPKETNAKKDDFQHTNIVSKDTSRDIIKAENDPSSKKTSNFATIAACVGAIVVLCGLFLLTLVLCVYALSQKNHGGRKLRKYRLGADERRKIAKNKEVDTNNQSKYDEEIAGNNGSFRRVCLDPTCDLEDSSKRPSQFTDDVFRKYSVLRQPVK